MTTTKIELALRKRFWLPLGLGLLLQTGCAGLLIAGGAAAGIGGYAYVKGELKSTESASLDQVWTATLGAMDELKYAVTTQEKDAVSAHLVARTAQDKRIDVHLKAISDDSTEIRIRVGTFGDEALSLLILDKIKKKL